MAPARPPASRTSASVFAPTQGATAPHLQEFAEGERLGPFLLLRQLGRGGFAPVWLAREQYGDVELRLVALKLFALERGAGDAPTDERSVVQEARALCQVEHPNVVRFYSISIDPKRRLVGLAMEYLSGRALDRELAERGALPLDEVIEVGLSVALALSAVHRAAVVHRDVKPANIIRTATGYKLIDFGISHRPTSNNGEQLVTASDVVIPSESNSQIHHIAVVASNGTTAPRDVSALCGTLGYMDPECLSTFSAPKSPQSDLYALGATLFELLTKRLPAASGSVLRGEVLDGRRRPESLADACPGAPAELVDLVDRLLLPRTSQRPRSAEWVASRLSQMRHRKLGHARALPSEDAGPFRGLGRFESDDRGVYFGRSLEISQALEVLRLRGLVALLGPSGSGKSSLARAGVLPAIMDGELNGWPSEWDSVICVPGDDPRENLLAAIAAFSKRLPPAPAADELTFALADHAQSSGRGLVVLVDQLEELATRSRGPSRDYLVAFLSRVAEQPLPGLRVVVTARRDLLDPLLGLSGLGRALLPNAVLIDAMSALTWTSVLEQALSAYGYTWQSEHLKHEVAAEIERTASAMPLVQFALSRLWDTRDRAQRCLTEARFDELGGIAGALAQHAELTLEGLRGRVRDVDESARRVLLALTTAQGTRAVVVREELERELGEAAVEVLQAFERARLLVRLPEGYALSHEVLLAEWPRLRGWLAEARDARLLLAELEHDAQRFRADPELVPLWRKRRLALAEDAMQRTRLTASEAARGFLTAGLRAERRRRFVLTAGVAALAISVLVASVAYLRAVQSERERTERALERERESRKLAQAQSHIAEEQTREVQRAQRRIDELVRTMADSPQKSEVIALQEQIRGAHVSSGRTPLRPKREGPESEPVAAPRVSASPAEAPPEPPKIRVQNDW